MKVVRGAVGGVAGSISMSFARIAAKRAGLLRESPPEAITRQRLAVPGAARPLVAGAAHLGYGALAGAAFGALPRSIRDRRGAGAAYGAATWILFEGAIAPALDLVQARERRPLERAVLLADHLVYGVVVARVVRGSR